MSTLRLHQKLAKKRLKVFTTTDFRRALGLSRASAYKALERYVKQGAIVRLKNGLYLLAWENTHSFLLGNLLVRPSYLSYETALSFHHLIPESVYAVTSATTRRSRELEVQQRGYIYHAIKRQTYTGYSGRKLGEDTVLMADPEKALCDYLHLVFFKKKTLNDRLNWGKVHLNKLLRYARLFKPKAFARWIKYDIARRNRQAGF